MVENLGLVRIRHFANDVFYAEIEVQSNVAVDTPAVTRPFPEITVESVRKDPVFSALQSPMREDVPLLEDYAVRFPCPSYDQCCRLASQLGYTKREAIMLEDWYVAT